MVAEKNLGSRPDILNMCEHSEVSEPEVEESSVRHVNSPTMATEALFNSYRIEGL